MSRLTDARAAIADIAPAFVRLVRESTDAGPVVGRWGRGDVARHICLVIGVDTDAIAGRPLPTTELRPAAVAAMNDAMLADDPERDMGALTDRIEALLGDFLEVSSAPVSEQVTWLGDVRIPASAAACHLLEEMLVHGFDMASGTNGRWTIAPAHAALAIAGAVVPIVNAAGPLAFVDPARAQGFRARLDVRVRGHQRFAFVFDDGMTVEDGASEPVDVHVSADPVTLLLLMLGRVSATRAILRGKATAWGRRPWQLPRALALLAPP